MGIYRGAGGSGDAINDASSEALLTVQARDAALAAQAAAETARTAAQASQAAALVAQLNAQTAETNAETAETNAETAETGALAAQTAAEAAQAAAEAAQAAAETAETNAETAETNAETAETNAAASAALANDWATKTSGAVAGGEYSAKYHAQQSASSASAASTSATNASNSASAAATSASNAAASYDSFDDRYLGAKSSAPSLDNDGNTLLVGALYYDTTSSSMKVWSGSAWLDAYVSLSGALIATNNLSDLNNAATARTNLGVAIGVNVQAYDAQLADIAGLTPTDNNFIVGNGTNFVTESGSTARTSLGLGSIATQDANNVAVTGGSINGTTVGASTPSTGSFTSLTDSGNLTFTGTGNRITGDFSNATVANRVAFQTSTTNGNTTVYALPNGTATTSGFFANTDSTLTNGSEVRLSVDGTTVTLNSAIRGSGTYLPLTLSTGGSERLRIDTSGNVGIGLTPTASVGALQVSGGAFASSTLYVGQTGSTAFSGGIQNLSNTSRSISIESDPTNAGANSLMYFNVDGTTRMAIDSSGNVGIGTSSPQARLDVSGGSIRVNEDGAGTKVITIRSNYAGVDPAINVTTNNALLFLTNNTERMRIDSAGLVGIGTSSPATQLEVKGTGFVAAQISGDSTSETQLRFATNTAARISQQANQALLFDTNNTERMRIDSSGNVGIGTSSPSYDVDVVRNVNGNVTSAVQNSNSGASAFTRFLAIANGGNAQFGMTSTGYTAITGAQDAMLFNSGGSSGGIVFAQEGVAQVKITSSGLITTNIEGSGTLYAAYSARAWVNFDGTANTNLSGTYSQTGTTVTVTITGHGYITGQTAYLDFTTGTAVDGSYTVTVTDANTFTVTQASRTTSGNVTSIRSTIRGSGNVSSITDNGTGSYTVNFTNALPDANYACGVNHSTLTNDTSSTSNAAVVDKTTSSFRFDAESGNSTPVQTDFATIDIIVVR